MSACTTAFPSTSQEALLVEREVFTRMKSHDSRVKDNPDVVNRMLTEDLLTKYERSIQFAEERVAIATEVGRLCNWHSHR